MYTAIELKELSVKPRINDITLQTLADYYNIFLNPFIYIYSVKGIIKKKIELRFNKENFCHLVGLETIVKYSISFKELHKYKGIDGWNNIYGNNKDGFILDIPHLKKINKRNFQNVKAKFVYFYLLPNLIQDPLSVNFKNDNVYPPTKIECDIMFYSKVKNDKAIIHLGIKKHSDEDYYIPKTFFVEKVSNKKDDVYLAKQENIETTVLNNVIML